MPTCEICGRDCASTREVTLEGAQLQACNRCAKLGEPVHRSKPSSFSQTARPRPKISRPPQRLSPPRSRSYKPEIIPVENFRALIRKAREDRGMSQKDVARQLNERSSVIAKLESGKMSPTISLARKLEHLFKITLLEEAESIDLSTGSSYSSTTLGDVVEIKRKKPSS